MPRWRPNGLTTGPRREMIEETGLDAGQLARVFHYIVSPGSSTESVFLYCTQVDAANAGGVHGMTDEHENTHVFSLQADQAFELMDQGRIINAMTIIGLQWLKANRDRVLAEWRP